MLKRLLSIVLSTIIILSVFSILPASAEETSTTEYTVEDYSDDVDSDDHLVDLPGPEPYAEYETEAAVDKSTNTTESTGVPNQESNNESVISSFKSDLALTGTDVDNYEQTSRYVPNYVLTGSTVQPVYNPSTVEMLADMSNLAYDLDNNDPSWKNDLKNKYGYTQFYHVIDSGTYQIGTVTENETYIGDDGKEHVRQVTRERMFSGCNATVAFKETYYNGEKLYAIAIAFKGTNIWDIGDDLADISFVSNSDGIHTGFANNSAAFYEQTKSIQFNVEGELVSLYDMIQDMKNEDSPYRMLVTGHSLGAALADVFVGYHLYNDGINSRNVLAYTFAAPKSCKNSYSFPNNIFNIINNDDYVPTVGGEKQIGTNYVYTPDDTFRAEFYGEHYKEGHNSAWWKSFVNQAWHFCAHSMGNTYQPIIENMAYVDDDGNAFIDSYTKYHTRGNNTWNSLTLDNNCYQEIDGSLSITKDMTLSWNSYTVNGNLSIGKNLVFNNAMLTVKNDAVVVNLEMTHESDYFLVEGSFRLTGYATSLSAGTLEIKKDFRIMGYSGSKNYYNESNKHTTILSGIEPQLVYIVTPIRCVFYNLVIKNENIDFYIPSNGIGNYIASMKLSHDAIFSTTKNIKVGSLNLNGYCLHTNGNIAVADSFIMPEGSSLECNDLSVGSDIVLCEGYHTINGDLGVTKSITFSETHLIVKGNCTVRELLMNHETDYLLVEGNFTVYQESTYSCLSAGTVEIKGNFNQTDGTLSNYGYWDSGTHKTIFSGTDTQTITLNKNNKNQFANLYINNPDIVFASSIRYIRLAKDTVISSDILNVSDDLDLNGYSLTYGGDINAGKIFIRDGKTIDCKSITSSNYVVVYDDGCINCDELNAKDIELNGGTHTINGNVIATGQVTFNKSRLIVCGECELVSLEMTHAEDYLLIEEKCTLKGRSTNLSDGTVEVKDDFYITGYGGDSYCYNETNNHKTILSGEERQYVFIGTPHRCRFSNLVLLNSDIDFRTTAYFDRPITYIRLAHNADITTTTFLDVSTLDMNGYSLCTKGNIIVTNSFNIPIGSNLECNNLTVKNDLVLNGGNHTINGDLGVTNSITTNETNLIVKGNCQARELIMKHNTDYLLVEGNLNVVYESKNNNLTAGIVEIKGDFIQSSSSSDGYGYYESGMHNTVFSGSSLQTVTLNKSSRSMFTTLVLENKSSEGVVFNSNISVNKLFNHNGRYYSLYNGGTGSSFVDYDGDGMKDNVDPYPTDPTNTPPEELEFTGHSLTLEGDIGVNFYVDVPEESIDDVESVTFTWEVNGIEKTHSVSLIDCDKNDLGYKLSCPVPAAEMNYEITATVTVGGETYTNSYSAVTYAQTILSDDYRTSYLADNHTEAEYNELATLVKTMLDYGAKAQIQFNRNVDHLANEGIDYTPTEVTADTIGDTGASDMRAGLAAYGLEYNGSSIVYLSETSMRHYYKIVDEDLFNAVKDNITFDGKKVSYTWKNGEIYFELKNIAAAELDDLYTLKIGDSEYKYSVLDYLKACLSSDKTTANMKALAAATYLYNQAANAYFD